MVFVFSHRAFWSKMRVQKCLGAIIICLDLHNFYDNSIMYYFPPQNWTE